MTARTMKLSTLLRATSACEEAREWAKPYATLQEAWDVCPRGDWMLWLCAAVEMEHPAFKQIAYACANMALRDASKALRAAASESLVANHAKALRRHAASLDACNVDSRATASTASAAASAACAASVASAAWDAAWATSAAAIAKLVRQHIPDVTPILEAYDKRQPQEGDANA